MTVVRDNFIKLIHRGLCSYQSTFPFDFDFLDLYKANFTVNVLTERNSFLVLFMPCSFLLGPEEEELGLIHFFFLTPCPGIFLLYLKCYCILALVIPKRSELK